jgi:hypothetical protein
MFCYFIQKKGFLDQDKNYLKNKLNQCKSLSGNGKFYNFYRTFLLELFHDGLGKPQDKRPADLPVDMGRIPYLNGGLFDVHELEKQYQQIHISDEAFEAIFDFFDKWEWHLDTREHAEGRTINPDVIGYIFEKYINDRAAMGAYYTKEDITDYIAKNTIIPFLFDETERHYEAPFKADGELWQTLKKSGDTYIYEAVKKGVPNESGLFDDLPDDVQAGFDPDLEQQVVQEENKPHLWEIRKPWNREAPSDIALPTELYREVIERRKRYAEVKKKIDSGKITNINDFITYNLNIRQFIQDFIETTEDPEFIKQFYKALNKITILDPTCGSGAFLFAAMNILEPLYETCIKRMEEFVEEQPGKFKYFEDTLAEVENDQHPNLPYFIFKSIILNNLFGVDIMKEAVEIAKLRLFLKLVATVDVDPKKQNFGLEPLPDIDFNIRAGNTLVGFATQEQLKTSLKTQLFSADNKTADEKLEEFEEDFQLVSQAFKRFQDSQLINNIGSGDFRETKQKLKNELNVLNDKLNEYLAHSYGVTKYEDLGGNTKLFPTANGIQQETKEYKNWLESHQPFHWFAEFYHIIAVNGGFDVIIGNPPYVVYNSKSFSYKPQNFKTLKCANLFAFCTERSYSILNGIGYFSFIVPNSSISADKLSELQNIITTNKKTWISNYAWRPSKLFEGANMLLAIVISTNNPHNVTYSSPYYRWNNEERKYLFQRLKYNNVSNIKIKGSIPKVSSNQYFSLHKKLKQNQKKLVQFLFPRKTNHVLYYFRAVLYWVKILDVHPYFKEDGKEKITGEMKSLFFENEEIKLSFISLLSSNMFYITSELFYIG